MSEIRDSLEKSDETSNTSEEAAKEDNVHKDSSEEKSDQTPDEKSPDAEEGAAKGVSHENERDSSSEPLEGAVGGIDSNFPLPLVLPPDFDSPDDPAHPEFPVEERPYTFEKLLLANRVLKRHLEDLRNVLRIAIERAQARLLRLNMDWEAYVQDAVRMFGLLPVEEQVPILYRENWLPEYFLPGCERTATRIQTVHLSRCIVHDDIVKLYESNPELRKTENAPSSDPDNSGAFDDDSEEHLQFVRIRREKARLEERIACLIFDYGFQLTPNHIVALENYLARLLSRREFERVSIFTQEAIKREKSSDGSDDHDHSSNDASDLPVDDATGSSRDGNRPPVPTEKSSSSDSIPRVPSCTPIKEELSKKPCPFDRKDSLANIPPLPVDESPADKPVDKTEEESQPKTEEELQKLKDEEELQKLKDEELQLKDKDESPVEKPEDKTKEELQTKTEEELQKLKDKEELEQKTKEELQTLKNGVKDSSTHTDEEKSAASGTPEDLTGDEDSNPIEEQKKAKLYRPRPTNQDEGNDTSA